MVPTMTFILADREIVSTNYSQGKEINMWSTHIDLLHTHGEPHKASHKSPRSLLWGACYHWVVASRMDYGKSD
ncbi:unnamed protein product [Prunus armeniaca]